MTQLAQRLRLDLAYAFAGHREVLAHFFERVLAAVADAEAHLDDLLFARGQRLQHRFGLLLQVEVDHRFRRRHRGAVLDEVAEVRIFLFADRRLERDRLLRDLQDLADLRDRDVHAARDLFRGRLAAKLLHQRARRANQLVDRLDHVDRDADGARLVGDRAGDRLPDPPRRVGRELVAAAVLELVDRLHQADVAFLDQVEELQAAVGVLLGDRDDETEVGLDQLLLRLLGLRLAAHDHFERVAEMVDALLQIFGALLDLGLEIIHALGHGLALFLLELRLARLEVELLLQLVVLALLLRDPLDDVLHFFDEAALDRLGELDLADVARGLDLGAHHLPAGAAVLALVGARHALELFVELLDVEARLADGVDLLEELLRALLDLVFGDLFVVEDDELADGALAGAQLIAHADDRLGDRGHARDRLDDRQLAALDAPRDLDFAFAREERHGAHLAHVHADRIVGLVERAGRQVELGAFAF